MHVPANDYYDLLMTVIIVDPGTTHKQVLLISHWKLSEKEGDEE